MPLVGEGFFPLHFTGILSSVNYVFVFRTYASFCIPALQAIQGYWRWNYGVNSNSIPLTLVTFWMYESNMNPSWILNTESPVAFCSQLAPRVSLISVFSTRFGPGDWVRELYLPVPHTHDMIGSPLGGIYLYTNWTDLGHRQ